MPVYTHNVTPHAPLSNAELLVFEACHPSYEAVIAEPENVYFEVFQNPKKPGEIRFIKHWNASVEWFMNVNVSELVECLEVLMAA
jgi:quinol monooxygenase YgiN